MFLMKGGDIISHKLIFIKKPNQTFLDRLAELHPVKISDNLYVVENEFESESIFFNLSQTISKDAFLLVTTLGETYSQNCE